MVDHRIRGTVYWVASELMAAQEGIAGGLILPNSSSCVQVSWLSTCCDDFSIPTCGLKYYLGIAGGD